jgi:hypothetical protein
MFHFDPDDFIMHDDVNDQNDIQLLQAGLSSLIIFQINIEFYQRKAEPWWSQTKQVRTL